MMSFGDTISEAQRLGRLFFELDFPCTQAQFKSAFRKAAKALHTDTSGGDTKEKFVLMKEAYDLILDAAQKIPGFFAADEGNEAATAPAFLTTVDGTLLAGLGLGLGPTTNGSDCPVCQHKGYTEQFGYGFIVCGTCDKDGRVKIGTPGRCRYCNGAGSRWVAGRSRPARCYTCRGSGYQSGYEDCGRCRGTKTVRSEKEGTYYQKCYKCSGSGELPMFNPVFIKGSLRA